MAGLYGGFDVLDYLLFDEGPPQPCYDFTNKRSRTTVDASRPGMSAHEAGQLLQGLYNISLHVGQTPIM